jgi:hypothetical protein
MMMESPKNFIYPNNSFSDHKEKSSKLPKKGLYKNKNQPK